MPYYTYKCTTCDFERSEFQKISDRDAPVGQPHDECGGTFIRPPELPGFTSSESLGRIKAPREFRDLLSTIKKQNPGSNIKER